MEYTIMALFASALLLALIAPSSYPLSAQNPAAQHERIQTNLSDENVVASASATDRLDILTDPELAQVHGDPHMSEMASNVMDDGFEITVRGPLRPYSDFVENAVRMQTETWIELMM